MNSYNILIIEEKIDEIVLKPAKWKYDDYKQAKQQLLSLIQEEKTKARIDEIKQIMPPEQYKDYAKIMGKEFCHVCGFNSEVFRKHLTDRLQALKQGE